jgi:hypothetical protein
MRFARVLGFLGVLLLLLSACSLGQPTPNTATVAPVAQTPAADTTIATRQPVVVQTPASDQVGTVTGQLIRLQTKGDPEPLADAPIYLGTILKNPDGQDRLVEVSPETSPKTNADDQGRFVFTNIPAGRYGLMLDTPVGTLLLNNPDTGADLIVEVTGGKVLDLGELKYQFDY